MLPTDILSQEHRVIEQVLNCLEEMVRQCREQGRLDRQAAKDAVDFFRNFADRCHHGKEGDLLFKALAAKDLSSEHRRTMDDLIREHAWAREATASLVKAKEAYLLEKPGALDDLMEHLGKLVDFYPRHIDKEDKHFFIPCMAYFSEAEQADLLARMHEFDRQLIHEKYRGVVESMEQRRGCKTC